TGTKPRAMRSSSACRTCWRASVERTDDGFDRREDRTALGERERGVQITFEIAIPVEPGDRASDRVARGRAPPARRQWRAKVQGLGRQQQLDGDDLPQHADGRADLQ